MVGAQFIWLETPSRKKDIEKYFPGNSVATSQLKTKDEKYKNQSEMAGH
jgi:hypothetical protein